MKSITVRKAYDSILLWLRRLAASLPRYAAIGMVGAILLAPTGSETFSEEQAVTIPTITIVAVESNTEVTVRTSNFPADHTFTVTMGPMGSRGTNGYVVGTVDSGEGGSFEETFAIPDPLHDSTRIAIRLQSGGIFPYFSYNWFYNRTTAGPLSAPEDGGDTPTSGSYMGIPTFSIVDVVADNSVTIKTRNFPAQATFDVTMGAFGTRGLGGISVGTLDSGTGGELEATYNIPAELQGARRIAIRTQTNHVNPFFAYNWFYNNSTAVSDGDGGTDSGSEETPPTTYSGIPTISVEAVSRDESVTLRTHNFPANQAFTVRMGPFGTRGIGGTVAAVVDSEDGSDMSISVPIPESVRGLDRIAVRLRTGHAQPYFAYNWFFNTTTP